jgi:hypothetical protein
MTFAQLYRVLVQNTGSLPSQGRPNALRARLERNDSSSDSILDSRRSSRSSAKLRGMPALIVSLSLSLEGKLLAIDAIEMHNAFQFQSSASEKM